MQMWRLVQADQRPANDESAKKESKDILLTALICLIVFSVGFGVLFVAMNSRIAEEGFTHLLLAMLAWGINWQVMRARRRAAALRHLFLQDARGKLYVTGYLNPLLRAYALQQGIDKALVPTKNDDTLFSMESSEKKMEEWADALDNYGVLEQFAKQKQFGGLARQFVSVQSVRSNMWGTHIIEATVLLPNGREVPLMLHLPSDFAGWEALKEKLEKLKC
jgi:hypothetical protein